jgi:TonB C terminal
MGESLQRVGLRLPDEFLALVRSVRASSRHWCISSAAALLTALVHLTLVASLVADGASHKHPPPPDQPGAGASALRSSGQIVEAMTLVDLLHTQPSDEPPLEELSSLGIEIPAASLVLASPELTPPPELDVESNEESDAVEAAGDTQGHAAMFGRYLGQITARIERTWQRPRTAVGAPRFSCQTKIEQDERGKVLSVELRHCTGDARWQLSLVSAIEHASPLPAPPIPSVFARMLVLNFSADAWEDGRANARLYEPEIRVAAAGDLATERVAQHGGMTLAEAASKGGNLDLRSEGGKLVWKWRDSPREEAEPQTASDDAASNGGAAPTTGTQTKSNE